MTDPWAEGQRQYAERRDVDLEVKRGGQVVTAQLSLTGPDRLQDAINFCRDNPAAETFIVRVARDDVAQGFQPSMDYAWHLLRRSRLVSHTGGPFLCNDRLTSSMSRYLKGKYGIPFETRRTQYDEWGAA